MTVNRNGYTDHVIPHLIREAAMQAGSLMMLANDVDRCGDRDSEYADFAVADLERALKEGREAESRWSLAVAQAEEALARRKDLMAGGGEAVA